jgi:hypothetical protein
VEWYGQHSIWGYQSGSLRIFVFCANFDPSLPASCCALFFISWQLFVTVCIIREAERVPAEFTFSSVLCVILQGYKARSFVLVLIFPITFFVR